MFPKFQSPPPLSCTVMNTRLYINTMGDEIHQCYEYNAAAAAAKNVNPSGFCVFLPMFHCSSKFSAKCGSESSGPCFHRLWSKLCGILGSGGGCSSTLVGVVPFKFWTCQRQTCMASCTLTKSHSSSTRSMSPDFGGVKWPSLFGLAIAICEK